MRVGCPEGNKVRLCPDRAIMIEREKPRFALVLLHGHAGGRESSLSPASQPEDPIEDRDANERRDPACEGNAQCDLRFT